MEKVAYVILAIVAIAWLIAMIVGMVAAFPAGIIGLVVILAFGLLFVKALKERLASKKNDRYSKDVEK
ncbi:MAG: hypothetical protein JSW40_08145 [Candidatus Omnitrophota bacterium]|nr:MAG: hypothetical protein JSW40_08145 [Candidatus Omnitrophota bacterium]